jgi:hypothetical protein
LTHFDRRGIIYVIDLLVHSTKNLRTLKTIAQPF